MTDAKKEIEELKKEVAALKNALSGKEDKSEPKKEFKPQPYQQYDPTAGMSMPRSALEAMIAAEPRGFMAGVVRDNRAPGPGNQSAIPSTASGPRPSAGDGKGWVEPRPLGPPPGVAQADRLMDHQDKLDRAELARKLGKG
jgi:hypothetical protein